MFGDEAIQSTFKARATALSRYFRFDMFPKKSESFFPAASAATDVDASFVVEQRSAFSEAARRLYSPVLHFACHSESNSRLPISS